MRLPASMLLTLIAIREIDVALGQLETVSLLVATLEGTGANTGYRLHPLLQETLTACIARIEIDKPSLHRSAWRWFRDHDAVEEAVRHALLAGDSDAAADLLEDGGECLQLAGRQRKLVALLRMLPTHQVQSHPRAAALASAHPVV